MKKSYKAQDLNLVTILLLVALVLMMFSCKSAEPCGSPRQVEKFDRKPFRAQHITKQKDGNYLVITRVRTPKGFESRKNLFDCCPDSATLSKL